MCCNEKVYCKIHHVMIQTVDKHRRILLLMHKWQRWDKYIFLGIAEIVFMVLQIVIFLNLYKNVFNFSFFVRLEITSLILLLGEKKSLMRLNVLLFLGCTIMSVVLRPAYTIGQAAELVAEEMQEDRIIIEAEYETSLVVTRQGWICRDYVFYGTLRDEEKQRVIIYVDPETGAYRME